MALRRNLLLFGVWVLLMYTACSEVATNHPQAVEERCGVCHDLPPQDSSTELQIHFNHVIDVNMERNLQCWQCHLNCDTIMIRSTIKTVNDLQEVIKDTTYPVLVWTLDSLHRNGKFDLDSNSKQCHLCHDYQYCDDCHQVPPNDPVDPISQRIHNVHATLQGMGCDSCHAGYDPIKKVFPVVKKNGTLETTHDDGDTNVIFDIMKKAGYPDPFFNASNKTCNYVYCHGAWVIGGKKSIAITDREPTDSTKCSFCHNLDSLRANGPTHSVPAMADLFPECLNCHEGYRLKTLATNELTHRNGKVDTIPCVKCDECHSYPHACTR